MMFCYEYSKLYGKQCGSRSSGFLRRSRSIWIYNACVNKLIDRVKLANVPVPLIDVKFSYILDTNNYGHIWSVFRVKTL